MTNVVAINPIRELVDSLTKASNAASDCIRALLPELANAFRKHGASLPDKITTNVCLESDQSGMIFFTDRSSSKTTVILVRSQDEPHWFQSDTWNPMLQRHFDLLESPFQSVIRSVLSEIGVHYDFKANVSVGHYVIMGEPVEKIDGLTIYPRIYIRFERPGKRLLARMYYDQHFGEFKELTTGQISQEEAASRTYKNFRFEHNEAVIADNEQEVMQVYENMLMEKRYAAA